MMAKENDEVHQNGSGCSSGNNGSSGDAVGVTLTAQNSEMSAIAIVSETAATTAGEAVGDGDAGLADEKDKVIDGSCDGDIGGGEGVCESSSSYGRVKLNDLVADLCINNGLPRCAVTTATTAGTGGAASNSGGSGGVSGNGGYGDYTNIRATAGPTVYVEGTSSLFGKAAEPAWEGSNAIQQTQQQQQSHVQAPTQNSSFSFKHFLSSGNTLTAPTSTVTSLDPAATSCGTHNNTNSNTNATPTSSTNVSNPLQTSTGARPKVPQSASLSTTSIASLSGGGLSAGGAGQDSSAFGSSATKMKRSPRFSSFDSQASLAEYAAVGADSELECSGGVRASCGGASTVFRLFPEALGGESGDLFSSRISSNLGSNSTTATGNNVGDYTERQYVPRSYSNYDMPMPATSSPRRRAAVSTTGNSSGSSSGAKEARPTRLALNTNSSKMKLDLPIDDVSNVTASASATAVSSTAASRPTSNNAGEFPPSAAAAALPDFVQDHWMDSWYAHEMHLNSPPNSPIRGFGDDAIGTAAAGVGGGASVGAGDGVLPAYNSTAAAGVGVVGGVGVGSAATETSGNSTMLPDFLSDGPIIHSSQRLADVAVGLPSNSIGSPDDPPMSSQLTRLRIENERLQRELNDARVALGDQTRRTNELERQLQERQRSDASYSRNMSQKVSVTEESLDKSKMRTAAAQSHVVKLKQQVIQLTAEVETLRRENDVLREEGAVGGYSAPSCDRARAFATEAAAGVRANVSRPSRTQQISKDLRRAASNAENNLRQLLTGVENLRQMAADIENSELRLDYDVSPDLFSDFLDDCDDYEEYPGGPAL